MIPLVALADVKRNLIIEVNDYDADITAKTALVSGVYMGYLKLTAIPQEWLDADPVEASPIQVISLGTSPESTAVIPAALQSAILLGVAKLYEDRESANLFAQEIVNILELCPTTDGGSGRLPSLA